MLSTCVSVCPSLLFQNIWTTQQNEYNYALDSHFPTKVPNDTQPEHN